MYTRLLARQSAALAHAERLASLHGVAPEGRTPASKADPCTTVHRLVKALNDQIS